MNDSLAAQIDLRVARALGRVRRAFRGVLTRVGAGAGVQLAQVDGLPGEQLQDAELFQQYGFTSAPPAGTMVVVLPVGGQTAHGIVIACEHGGYRLAGLQPGEVAVYNQWGDSVVLKAGGIAEVTAATKVRLATPRLEVTGDIVDRCDIQSRTVGELREVYNIHTHPGDSGGTTGQPHQTL